MREIERYAPIYEACDGKQFDTEEEALDWEARLYYEGNVQPRIFAFGEDELIPIESLEEFKTIARYYDYEGIAFKYEFEPAELTFPILVKSDRYGDVSFCDEDYQTAKEICKMYERAYGIQGS
jgi:hypothetical protein